MATSIQEIIVYPVKSLAGISLQSAKVEPKGLRHDRRWALVDTSGAVLTAREHPALLQLQTKLNANGVQVTSPSAESIEIPFESSLQDDHRSNEALSIFKDSVTGSEVDAQLNLFFSDYLGVSCRLMGTSATIHRPVATRHGGKPGDTVGYADSCPLLLTNSASLTQLNRQISEGLNGEGHGGDIPMRQFRPNVVVQGADPYSEESWSELITNDLQFEVAQLCKRCNLATTHPDNSQLHPLQEPLRTLAKTRPRFNGGVAFGIHLTPRQLIKADSDSIAVGDVVSPIIG